MIFHVCYVLCLIVVVWYVEIEFTFARRLCPWENGNMVRKILMFVLCCMFRLFHPVKRMKIGNDSQSQSGDRPNDSSDCGTTGKHLNGNMMVKVVVSKFGWKFVCYISIFLVYSLTWKLENRPIMTKTAGASPAKEKNPTRG